MEKAKKIGSIPFYVAEARILKNPGKSKRIKDHFMRFEDKLYTVYFIALAVSGPVEKKFYCCKARRYIMLYKRVKIVKVKSYGYTVKDKAILNKIDIVFLRDLNHRQLNLACSSCLAGYE